MWYYFSWNGPSLSLDDVKVFANASSSLSCSENYFPVLKPFLEDYCHCKAAYKTDGKEGDLLGKHNLKLVQVHMIARHGDRSPASSVRMGKKSVYECGFERSDEKWLGLLDFAINPFPGSRINSRKVQFPGFHRKKCSVGQLTSIGYMQHYFLGSLMRKKYISFVQGLKPTDFFVHSTDYSRTIQSASAFLLGFFNQTAFRKDVSINVSPGSVLSSPPPGTPLRFTACTKSKFKKILLSELNSSGFFPKALQRGYHLIEKLCKMFSLDCNKHNDTFGDLAVSLVDALLCIGCHQLPLPCNSAQQCVSPSFAAELMNFSEWVWSERYPRIASLLAMQPFIYHSVVNQMDRAITFQNSYRFMWSFAHDSVISELLRILGFSLEKLIPYASRLVFELWTDGQNYFVRVLFNGIILNSNNLGLFSDMENSDFIPYSIWKQSLTSENYNLLCP